MPDPEVAAQLAHAERVHGAELYRLLRAATVPFPLLDQA